MGLVLAIALAGCGQVLGLDKFDHAGTDSVEVPACGALEAPNSEGACEAIGVKPEPAENACADPDGKGGCDYMVAAECFNLDYASPGTTECAPTCAAPDLFLTGQALYVKPDAEPDGDGTKAHPLRTIQDALNTFDRTRPATVLLGEGTFTETVHIAPGSGGSRPNVTIQGVCPEQTSIVAPPGVAPGPVVSIEDADVTLRGVAISGGETGILVHGGTLAVGKDQSPVRVHDTARFGIVADDASYIDLEGVRVERIGLRGIVVRGSTFRFEHVHVRDVGSGALRSAEPAGIVLEPSRYDDRDTPEWDPSRSHKSSADWFAGILIENVDTGVIVEGSNSWIGRAVIRDVRLGIVSRWRPAGPIPSGKTDIGQIVIERASEAAVVVWNQRTTLDGVTVRDSGGTCPDENPRPAGAYPGSAIRARFDTDGWAGGTPPPPPDGGAAVDSEVEVGEPGVDIRNSVIDGAHQAGILMEGGALLIDHSIIRGVDKETCTGKFGDGVVAYDYGFAHASVRISTSRISGSARTAVATFGAPVAIEGMALDGTGRGVVRNDAATPVTGSPSCEAGGHAIPCAPETQVDLQPAIVRAQCDDVEDGKVTPDCLRVCLTHYADQNRPAAGVTLSLWGEPRIAPARTDTSGCAALGGIESGRTYQLVATGPEIVPTTIPFVGSVTPQPLMARWAVPSYADLARARPEGFGVANPDLSAGMVVPTYACKKPSQDPSSLPATFAEICPEGFPEITAEMTPSSAATASGDAGVDAPGATGDTLPTPTIQGPLIYFTDVPPGDYTTTLLAPAGQTVSCHPGVVFERMADALPVENSKTQFSVAVRGGYVASGGSVYCTVTP